MWNSDTKKKDCVIDSLVSQLIRGCTRDEFLKFKCPVCGSSLLLAVHPNRKILFLRCGEDSTHLSIHREIEVWESWWTEFISKGWYN